MLLDETVLGKIVLGETVLGKLLLSPKIAYNPESTA